jgi:hypothetical protein
MRYAVLLVVLLATNVAFGGGSLSMRLVEASNAGSGVDSHLRDVASALKGQLPFNSYRLLSSGGASLPAGNTKTSLSGYSVTCNGPQNALKITISHGKRTLVSTTASLRNGRPILLGGFPSNGGKLIIVFVAR